MIVFFWQRWLRLPTLQIQLASFVSALKTLTETEILLSFYSSLRRRNAFELCAR